ncbi:uncharacterized protein LAESUDRAFT_536009 [Laetiporus sulphureus 93-53]|uniref:Uncharacterized protein n=1 Tax=Laetiporus sulphureus 93-53 TaxID=1314785 RepID=A0A165B9V6_9APHY|nr:uncharacterized protein LAESUDRAFT_536009 [Laetiporus sulphureus 93-53]KZT00583.1 hypothetical protein LAESUDRAFT_536009 [Laetiporus sulphureus 93-53]
MPPGAAVSEEQLASLYAQVLAGFGAESPTTDNPLQNGEGGLEHLHSQYGDDGGTPTLARQQSTLSVSSAQTFRGLPSSSMPVSPASSVQSPTQRGPRPLPRIPGQSPPPASPPLPPPPPPPPMLYTAMPEPRPYYPDETLPPPPPPKRSSAESCVCI